MEELQKYRISEAVRWAVFPGLLKSHKQNFHSSITHSMNTRVYSVCELYHNSGNETRNGFTPLGYTIMNE